MKTRSRHLLALGIVVWWAFALRAVWTATSIGYHTNDPMWALSVPALVTLAVIAPALAIYHCRQIAH